MDSKVLELSERERNIKHINLLFEGLSDKTIENIGILVMYLLLQEGKEVIDHE